MIWLPPKWLQVLSLPEISAGGPHSPELTLRFMLFLTLRSPFAFTILLLSSFFVPAHMPNSSSVCLLQALSQMSLNQRRQTWLSTSHHPRCGLETPPFTTPAFTCNTYQPMSLLSLPLNFELLERLEYFYLLYWCVLNTWKHLKNMCWKCSFKPNFQLLHPKH